jgi:hypothetical protein
MTKLPTKEELQREIKYLLSDSAFGCSLRLNRLRQLLTTLDLLAEIVPRLEHKRDCRSARCFLKAGKTQPGECDCNHDQLISRLRELGVEW